MTGRRLLPLVLLLLPGEVSLRASEPIKTPFQVMQLWSDEMVRHMTGGTQPACSGANAGTCERLNSGFCDGSAYFTVPPRTASAPATMPFRLPERQTNATRPQYFRVVLANAGSVSNLVHAIHDPGFQRIDLLFDCMFSGNDECPAGRFHLGALRSVEIDTAAGGKAVDVTRSARVLPDGTLAVPIEPAVRASLLADTRAIYKVSVAVECFTVKPTPIDFELPVRTGPSLDAPALGAVIARVTAGALMTLTYRPNTGAEVPFETDWTQHDWGYTYIRDQTILDRKGDWYLLPPRPFPTAVWIHLPDRGEPSHVSTGSVFSLRKPVQAQIKGTQRRITLAAGNIVPVAIRGQVLELRREEPSDSPCWAGDNRARRQNFRTYVVAAEEFYDRDRHLQLEPAYTKGC